MPIVKPCPKSCKFDWVQFHKDLDIAIVHMIDESEPGAPIEDYGPSYTSVMKLAEFSNGKKHLQELGQYAPESDSES